MIYINLTLNSHFLHNLKVMIVVWFGDILACIPCFRFGIII